MEAAKLGFSAAVVPAAHASTAPARSGGLRIVPCQGVTEALAAVLGAVPQESPGRKGRAASQPQAPEEELDEDMDEHSWP